MVQRKDETIDGRNQRDIGKPNHGDDLGERGDKEKVGEAQGEEHEDVAIGPRSPSSGGPPLAQRHLRL